MASKKKVPSFEIPDAVRDAGQSGWVYRTGEERARPRAQRRTTRVMPGAEGPRAMPAGETTGIQTTAPSTPQSQAAEPGTTSGAGMTGGLIGLGLQVVAVPLMVPLFLTAAVSKRLGMTSES